MTTLAGGCRGGVLLGLALVAWAMPASASVDDAPAVFAVHVGVNLPPPGARLPALRYADDDAVRFAAFSQSFARRSWTLTVLDEESARRHPGAVGTTRAPNRRGIEDTLAELSGALDEARLEGRRTVLLFSYSGHGVVSGAGVGLALLDGVLDRSFLSERLAALPADEVHLFLDACHAEGLVDARGVILEEGSASLAPAAPDAASQAFDRDFFERHPHVGAVLAASADQETHEWSRLEAGVFTHEVLSALRGPADVNGDGRVAYSELAAFVAAANRQVKDQKAVPRLITRPPRLRPGAVLVDQRWLSGEAFLVGGGEGLGHFYVERDDGLRVLDAHPDPGQPFSVAVPAGAKLWLRTDDAEASFSPADGERVAVADLGLAAADTRSRGSVASSLHEGLFQASYGPAYYAGWVDSQGLVPVDLSPPEKPAGPPTASTSTSVDERDDGGPAPGGVAGRLVDDDPTAVGGVPVRQVALFTTIGLAAGAAGALVLSAACASGMLVAYVQFASTDVQAPAVAAATQFYLFQAGALLFGAGAVTLAAGAVGTGVWWWVEGE